MVIPMKKILCLFLAPLMLVSPSVFFACSPSAPEEKGGTEATGDQSEPTGSAEPGDHGDYYVISVDDYMDKTTAGFVSQVVGFLSDYKYVWNPSLVPRVALPDSWFEICGGCDSGFSPYQTKIVKLFNNGESGLWEVWISDAFSIDILNQYILRDMYRSYGTLATKVITDGWVKYDVWDMGGGQRSVGAYALASRRGYISPFLGSAEFGNRYPWCQEPWIGNDTLGMVAAGMPNTALDLTKIFGRVTGDSDNVLWLDFIAAMSAMAYFESDIPTLIKKAAELFPEASWERFVVSRVFELYERFPDLENWRYAVVLAEKECARRFYYLHTGRSTNEQGRVDVNMAFILLGLLYGNGDYYQTAKILALTGYDTRGTIGLPILGIIGGMGSLPAAAKEKTWQDGKGVIVNLPIANTASGLWMYSGGLPERHKMAEIVEMYRKNFERILLENGGKIKDGKYYIPKSGLRVYDAIPIENADFEAGTLENFTVIGKGAEITEFSYWGKYAVKIYGSEEGSNGFYTIVSGLTPGSLYRMTAYVIADNATAYLFARAPGAREHRNAAVHSQTEFVKRDFVFTAESERMEIGILLEKQGAGGYAVMDEIVLTRIEENPVPGITGVKITSPGDGGDSYTGKITFEIDGKADREVYLKVSFSNITGGIIDAAVTVNGKSFNTVPFYKTGVGTTPGSSDFVYIPVILREDKNTVALDIKTASLNIASAEVITVSDRLLAR